MGALHPLPQHALRMAALAAIATLAIVITVLAFPFGSLGSQDPSPSAAAVRETAPPAAVESSDPDWVVRPLAPVTLAPAGG